MVSEYTILHINGAPEKDLVGTSVVNSIKEAHPDTKIVVVTHFPEIWLHNPDVYRVYRHGNAPYFYEDFVKDKKAKIFALDPYQTSDFIHKKKHLAEIWCDLLDIKYNGSLPKLYFTQREEEVAWRMTDTGEKFAIIQPFETHGFNNLQTSWVKDLPFDVVQKVVNAMRSAGYSVIQINRGDQPTFAGVTPVQLNLRLTLAAMKHMDKGLFIDSFAQHAAAALGKPSVVTWTTGLPKVTGYDMHENVFAKINTSIKQKIDEYSPVFDVTGALASQSVNMNDAYSAEEIIEKLDL